MENLKPVVVYLLKPLFQIILKSFHNNNTTITEICLELFKRAILVSVERVEGAINFF